MGNLLPPMLENVSATASLISALIAAAVAFIVLALNQSFSRRQQRIQFLQPKLEELYLLMNEVAERNTRLFKLLVASTHGDLGAKQELDSLDELAAYGHLTAKKMVMLVRLYFPKLSRIHQHLFAAERQLSQHMWELSTGDIPSLETLIEASGNVGHMLRLMEQEMVNNQGILLGASSLLRRYRSVTKEEIEGVPPPPDGPPLANMKR
ncbi:hypothetical protein [Nitratireductor sp. ZSWI3]|uniref:hypothetical protein n=1 Tax=Nitratireductor sp. ZSWI3 TaxID=2966359 RepID=UPI0021500FEC|nr:hypothetical protein [Nitratireductor sp. ZSWI3]MCR4268434.1 hypothetical protein [Nitratireductor sp. ZSWI3]